MAAADTIPSEHASAAVSAMTEYFHAAVTLAAENFKKVPGSAIIARYVASSYQNDPIRSLLELFLVLFALRTVLQSRTRGGASGKNFVNLSAREIDDLVAEFKPEPLCAPLTPAESRELASIPTIIGGASSKPKISLASHNAGKPTQVMNLASYNFTNLAGHDAVKDKAIETLRNYGVGSCSPPGFYGTIDVHMQLENDIARFLGTQKCIIYSQGFSTISSVIPAFSKRGDIIVADRGVNYAIQKGIQISRSTVYWYDHNDIDSLEATLEQVKRDTKRRNGPLTRRFIVTEGIFEADGALIDLPKIQELKKRYKFRLILDESISFGTVGATGRGLTELYNVPAADVEILVGSMANTLGAAGGFCAGSDEVVFHQRINGTSFVFSAALPAMLAVAASTALSYMVSQPSILSNLHDNVKAFRSVLDHIESLRISSDPRSPLVHIQIRSKTDRHPDTPADKFDKGKNSLAVGDVSLTLANSNDGKRIAAAGPQEHDLSVDEQLRLLQAIVDDALEHGIFISRMKRLPSINPKVLEVAPESRPNIRVAVSTAFTKKEMEKAANVIKASAIKVLGKRR
ncbi:related to LCB1-serine C-palmitoyltransferase subunit [Sporisorium reilianum f. sp. reilianum]|uniref:serine C-palmitoyltransferase n=1 Tax=Sporisorium reilianum f. sp. reilianum TaxID=72559 RepID=A0A2N8UG78_9BASI|nr:related to LCB1-serine C-palmitoyltransferase subunit [Sporisorium reilianum f. sp. reilianum]